VPSLTGLSKILPSLLLLKVLGLSQFSLMPQLPQKMTLNLKVVKFDSKIIISFFKSKSGIHFLDVDVVVVVVVVLVERGLPFNRFEPFEHFQVQEVIFYPKCTATGFRFVKIILIRLATLRIILNSLATLRNSSFLYLHKWVSQLAQR